MAATDKFIKVGNPGSATSLAAPGYTVGDGTITVVSTTNWPAGPAGCVFAIDIIGADGLRIDGTYNVYQGTVATATSITNVSHISGTGTNRNYPAGTTTRVYIVVASEIQNRLVDGLNEEHNQDGTHGAVTATSVSTGTLVVTGGSTLPAGDIVTADIATDAVTATKIDWASTGADAGIWWEELGRTILGTAGDTISIATIPARKYLRILIISIGSGTISQVIRFNNDSAANYAYRSAINGAADTSAASSTGVSLTNGDTNNLAFITIDVMNNSANEKMLHANVTLGPTGAANIPPRVELSGKWANTSAQITRVDLVNTNTGDFAIGSEVVVLGHN